MDTSKTISAYLNELSSSSPTPGGGNVAAFCGVLSSSLGQMVCNLTIGKKKYTDVEDELILLKDKLAEYSKRFAELAALDNAAFDQVMAAFKLPKETPEEQQIRSAKIEEATLGAAEVPAGVVRLCSEAIMAVREIAAKGNRNSLSDAGVAGLLLSASARGAYLNVLINCASLSNRPKADQLLNETEHLLSSVNEITNQIENEIITGLKT